MKSISIDIETYSSVDLKKCGVYKYAESEDFEILLFAYSVDGADVVVLDLANCETIPSEIVEALSNEEVIKTAFNATFERVCISKYLDEWLEPESWYCTLIWAATLGLPLSLEGIGAVLGLEKQKLSEGKSLISYFCKPCSPTKTNGGRTRNLTIHDTEKWDKFKEYNKRDVEVEMQIQNKLSCFPVPNEIWEEYHLSEEINDRGIAVDMKFVKNAIALDELTKSSLLTKMQQLTGLENPNSVMQMKTWLSQNGLEVDSLGKKDVAEVLKTAPSKLCEVLKLRQQTAKSSVKKYTAMENAVCRDSRVRGMFQFYGANRTGRYAGRIIQMQNLPQNHMQDLKQARELVKSKNFDAIEMLYDNPSEVLSELIRTAFVPQGDRKFIVSDFSAIEARVIAWLAGEKWRLDVFERGEDIYCASASQMFGIPVEKNGVNGHLRQKGKIAELALGYGGSVGALTAMGALDIGIAEEELKPLVDAWRLANPKINMLWWDVDKAVKDCVKQRVATSTHGIKFTYQSGFLFIHLPSGRKLAYVKPRIGENQFGGENVTYEGVGATKKWERIDSYGPKFVENIVQAISRDILMYAINTLRNCSIVAHVHDEVVIECDKRMSLNAVCEQMGRNVPWAEGLLLRADGYECEFYKKD
ncbi:MAG: DNA polymerase [Lachnospirales bacterium]